MEVCVKYYVLGGQVFFFVCWRLRKILRVSQAASIPSGSYFCCKCGRLRRLQQRLRRYYSTQNVGDRFEMVPPHPPQTRQGAPCQSPPHAAGYGGKAHSGKNKKPESNLFRMLWVCIKYYGFRKPQVSLRGATFVAKVAKTGGISGYPPKPPSTAEG